VPVIVVGFNRRTVALDMLERMTLSGAGLPRHSGAASWPGSVGVLPRAAVALVRERLGGLLDGYDVLMVGAGEVGEGMASVLAASAGARRVMVANRTTDRAVELAGRVGGRARPLLLPPERPRSPPARARRCPHERNPREAPTRPTV
jgi:hypothetical protein